MDLYRGSCLNTSPRDLANVNVMKQTCDRYSCIYPILIKNHTKIKIIIFLDEVYWLQYELKCICEITQKKPMGSNTNRIIVTNTFSRDTVTKSQRNIDNIIDQ